MQAMDEEHELPPMPNGLQITPKTTRLDVELRPPAAAAAGGGPRCELVLRLAMTEWHTWVGIGGSTGRVRRPRLLSRKKSLVLDVNSSGGGGPDNCRRLIGRAIKHSLSEEEEYRCLSPAHWDQAVPLGIEHALVLAVEQVAGDSGGEEGTCEVQLDISVSFDFVYSEAKQLLQACADNGGGDTCRTRSGGGDAPSCPICFENMSPEAGEVTGLPGCTHGFHTCCIAAWFHKASTCPVCRRDQLQYLPPDYRRLHDEMAFDPDDSDEMTFDPDDSLPADYS